MPQLDKFIFFSQYFWLFLFFFVAYFALIKWVLPSLLRSIKSRKLRFLALKQGREEESATPIGLIGLGGLVGLTVRSSSLRLSEFDRSVLPSSNFPLLTPFFPFFISTPSPFFQETVPLSLTLNRLLRLVSFSGVERWGFLKAVYFLPRLYPLLPFFNFNPYTPYTNLVGLNFFFSQSSLFSPFAETNNFFLPLRFLFFYYFELYLSLFSLTSFKTSQDPTSLFSLRPLSSSPLSTIKSNFIQLSGSSGI